VTARLPDAEGANASRHAGAAEPLAISARLASFAASFSYEQIPAGVRERAKHLMLDAAGIALASTSYDFAHRLRSGMTALAGEGDCSLIGWPERLPVRDAVLLNGALVHGLDYDDTHLGGAVHPTASAFPCALSMAERLDAHGRAMLAAYVLGVEVATRISMASGFGFHRFGFHPTGVVAHFSCALQAGWLLGLNERQLAMAQGLAGSTAAASQEFLADGAWNKRMHPGWGGVAGITAAYLAQSGFVGAARPYEGRFGVFRSFLHEAEADVHYDTILDGLGERWELEATSVKPYPVCHFIHACADAALTARREHDLQPHDIAGIRALLPAGGIEIVAEPAERKLAPRSAYDAQFSAPFVVAACLVLGRFGLAELQDDVRSSTQILALARKVTCEADPDSAFPKYYSGGVVITLRDGRELRYHEPVNRGAGDRALTASEIGDKFMANAQMVMNASRADALHDAMLDMDHHPARALARMLAA
jgi:2-methylcitrate dehydratase PrpD